MANALTWFTSAAFLAEIRHLCWTEPFQNGEEWDEGWHCRDQAVLTAAVAAANGLSCAIVDGTAAFVRGVGAGVAPLCVVVSPHTWVGIANAGVFDCSPRLSSVGEQRQPLDSRFHCVVQSSCDPAGQFEVATSDADLQSRVENAVERSGLTAIYTMGAGTGTYTDLSQHLLRDAFAFVNSPMTDRLRTRYEPTIYAQAAVHLFQLLRGKASSLTSCSQEEAWRQISEQPGDSVAYLARRGGFA